MIQKQAVVTGASEGIGRVFATALAARGFSVLAVARTQSALADLVSTLPGQGHAFVVADLGTAAGIALVEDRIRKVHVDLLVNNAGVGAVGGFTSQPRATHHHLLYLNITALTDLSHAFMQQAQAGDTLINVSSVLAFAPQPVQPIYSATKAFVTSLSESLWVEGKTRGVHVIGLHPGATDTRFGESSGRPKGARRPGWMMSSPASVVHTALRAVKKKKGPNIVPGLLNRLFCQATRWLPRKMTLAAMGRAS